MAQTPVGCIVPQLIAQDPEGTKVYIYSKYHGPANSRGFAGSGIQSVQSGALAGQSGLVGRKKEHLPQRTSQENKCERTPQFKSHCRRVVCTDHRSAVPRPARGARLYTVPGARDGEFPWPRRGRRCRWCTPWPTLNSSSAGVCWQRGASAEGAGSSALAAGANLTECVGASAEAHTSAGRDRDRAPLRSSTQLHDREPWHATVRRAGGRGGAGDAAGGERRGCG